MSIRIIPHSATFKDAVHAFNLRMRAGGSKWGFYVDPEPDWIPKHGAARAWREYHLALENDGVVRGGYALKPQEWLINGRLECVTDWQGPFTEGAVDLRYSALALRLIRDMLKKYPLLYSTGHGGDQEPIVQLVRTLGWTLHPMPFCLRILRPYRFLRRNGYLRKSRGLALLQDVLAMTGTGPVGILGLHTLLQLRHPRRSHAIATQVPDFGDWADSLWEQHRSAYRCLAFRDRAMMNALLPSTGWPGGTRLKIERDGRVIGWSVAHMKRMQGDHRFGDLFAAQISDCFGAPADAADVIAATHRYLAGQRVDLVCSNQSHPAWIGGFRKMGYAILNARRIFAISPQLKSRMEPFHDVVSGLHVTNMDGHGPHGFAENNH